MAQRVQCNISIESLSVVAYMAVCFLSEGSVKEKLKN
jgi:hypothetical protein